MSGRRRIIRIDRDLCDGCGICARACHEGAIEIRDGKAVLVKDSYCDGLGACIGECPRGALTIEEREADPFDPEEVEARKAGQPEAHDARPACACPSAAPRTFDRSQAEQPDEGAARSSMLSNWPVQITLVPVDAPFLRNADALLAADCVPFAFAGFHERFVKGRSVLVGCPKLDDAEAYLDKLGVIFATCGIRSLEVVYMQVPCCAGLVRLAGAARDRSGGVFPVRLTRIGLDGSILESVEAR